MVRLFFLHIMFLVCCFLVTVVSQLSTSEASFFHDMGKKDARYELTLNSLSLEDEKDFWMDQKRFESLLEKQNPKGYQSYLNGKHLIYRNHQILCREEHCNNSDAFKQRMAFYLINGQSIGASEVAMEIKKDQRKK